MGGVRADPTSPFLNPRLASASAAMSPACLSAAPPASFACPSVPLELWPITEEKVLIPRVSACSTAKLAETSEMSVRQTPETQKRGLEEVERHLVFGWDWWPHDCVGPP